MNTEKIYDALSSAYNLICDEYGSLCDDDLKEEYDSVLRQLQNAMGEFNK